MRILLAIANKLSTPHAYQHVFKTSKRAMKKDKVKVTDEVLSDERIKGFLNAEAPQGENQDFHRLNIAYRGMPPQYFERFLDFFIEQKGDINAQSSSGQNLLSQVQAHKLSQAYAELLLSKGAQ